MSGKENDKPSGEARDNAAVDDKGKAPMPSAAQPTLAASGPEAGGSVKVHPTVQTRLEQWGLKPGDFPPHLFDLTKGATAVSVAFLEWAWGLVMERKGEGKAPVPSDAVGVAPFADTDAGGPSAAAAAAPSANPSSSSSPSHRVDLAVPKFEDESGKTRKATREEIQKLLDNSFVVRTAEGAGETGKFPAALRAHFPKDINPDYHAEKSTVLFFPRARDLSNYYLSNKQEDEVIPGRLSNPYWTEGMTTAEMIKALEERGKEHKLSREEKKQWLDLETVEILTGKKCEYSIKVDVGWKEKPAGEATKAKRSQGAKTKRVVKTKRTSVMRPVCFLDLTTYLCDEIGVEVGTVAVLERFDKTISEVPIYALTIVGKVELP